jgi:polysaccharide export outer membrane protein
MKISNGMKTIRTVAIVLLLSVIGIHLPGCGDQFLDPTQIGRFRPVPAVNVILDSLGVAEETPSAWETAEDPRPIDVIAYETDYVLNPGDVVSVFIFELFADGVAFTNNYLISETGKISIPQVGVVEAAGLTESQLEEEIKQILSPSIIKDPSVTIILLNSQQHTFTILGNAVPSPGRYNIPRYDFRLTDALATAGVATQYNVSYVYVSRAVTGKEAIAEPLEPKVTEPAEPEEELLEPEREMMEIIAPRAHQQHRPNINDVGSRLVISSAEMITDKELAEVALPEGFEPLANDWQKRINLEDAQKSFPDPVGQRTIAGPINENEVGRIEWIFQDGKWIPIQVGRPRPLKPQVKVEPEKLIEPLKEKVPEDLSWDQIGAGGFQTRVIKIPTDRLAAGDPRYNIIIRPGDSIQVPVDIIGEFCIMGNINYQGFIPLTGRPMTLKMAIAAAGGLGPLAWPKRCEVVRRVSKEKEEIVMVDLDKIARGEQPDFFIKPNDLLNVGTHPTARWRAVLRNAFRATYGFGFVYDRNFADRDYGTSRPFGSLYDKIEDLF